MDVLTFHVKLYEKSRVKSKVLNSIKDKLSLNQLLIFDNDYQYHKIDTNYVVCRAFKKLSEVLRISRETIQKPHKLIVMLGKSAQDEINKASKDSFFKYKLFNSITQVSLKYF